jgi:hypothetical protein
MSATAATAAEPSRMYRTKHNSRRARAGREANNQVRRVAAYSLYLLA